MQHDVTIADVRRCLSAVSIAERGSGRLVVSPRVLGPVAKSFQKNENARGLDVIMQQDVRKDIKLGLDGRSRDTDTTPAICQSR